ncbi:Lrp/AsnC family transcriptional regulator [Jezberella montanilacus]|jgi:Lrp/AsnC family transcriptional regulator|uniref:Lrp/AsnC family transcriptional regulator n=1 Tax=Jezberella montanilacus TaxID=323426 RepID=A0A2T0XQB9_9BURK|nr:Lrp/AsnC family transcriptional regulator [Jezberella montanilacus]
MAIDKKDREILRLLQDDASVPLADLANAVSLTPTPCWRRIQKLQADGVIEKQVALCNATKLNLGLTTFVTIRTSQHNEQWMKSFVDGATAIPEIVEIYRLSGDADYLLKIVVPDISRYDSVYKRLIRSVDLLDVSSAFAMETIKCTTALPLDYA